MHSILGSGAAAAAILAPALCFAALGLVGEAPGEWGAGALIAWTALAATLIAGAAIQSGAGPAAWLVPALGLAAVMIGGPPGLAAAALAALALLALGAGLPTPRWLALALAAPPAVVALRLALE